MSSSWPTPAVAAAVLFLPISWLLIAAGPSTDGPATTSWPLRIDSPYGTISVYEPQPEKFDADRLTARLAISVVPPGQTDPQFGAMWLDAHVATDRDARTVTVDKADIKNVRLPGDADREQQIGPFLQDLLPQLNVTLPLDQVSANLEVANKERQATAQLQTTPPKVI